MALETQGIRFVLYSQEPNAIPEAVAVWREILPNREPDTVQRNLPAGPGLTQSLARSVVRGLGLTLTVQPTRLDLLIGQPENWSPSSLPKNPGPKALVEPVQVYGAKIIERFATTRVAVVLDLIEPAASWEDSSRKFAEALPLIKVPPAAREFAFTLNALRAFSTEGAGVMNRLCKWETALYQFVTLNAETATLSPSLTRHALSLQSDLSSQARTTTMETSIAQSVLTELCEETYLIAEHGYQRLMA